MNAAKTVSKVSAVLLALISLSLPACDKMRAGEKEGAEEHHKLVATSPLVKDVTVTQQYVCQIRSQKHIEVNALMDGYLNEIHVKEGQAVKKGEVLFRILPTLYQAKQSAEMAEAQLAQIKYTNTKMLYDSKPPVVALPEVLLAQAELDKANAKVKLANAEVDFTTVTAKFDGIVDRLNRQLGSLIEKKDVLTTLSDNSTMWVYFNVPEARYFEFKRRAGKSADPSRLELVDSRIELKLADGSIFKQNAGNVVTVEGEVNYETGNFKFRADFPNPDALLRHGQTGTVNILRRERNVVVIPQRAAFEILDKRYVWVVGEDHVAHQRPITIEHELDDIFIIQSGVDERDKIILEGVQQVHDGQTVEFEFRKPEEALAPKHQKFHAE